MNPSNRNAKKRSLRNRALNTAGKGARLAMLLFVAPSIAAGQKPSAKFSIGASASVAETAANAPTPLAQLVAEAARDNPQIIAARQAWRGATQIPSQVSTLPDPQFVVQNLSVGSPVPMAGFKTNNFAYIGLGVSQDLPYPGKLRLRGERARKQAGVLEDQSEAVRRAIIEQVEGTYYRLSYFQKAIEILKRDEGLIEQIEKISEARYRVGQGDQQDVLKAQLEQTRLLKNIALDREQFESLQSQLKQLLNRPQNSADIEPEALTETSLPFTSDQLLSFVRTGNPETASFKKKIEEAHVGVEIAHEGFKPDFNVQYMWQHTGAPFPDYYMVSFGIKLPVWRNRRQKPKLAQATDNLSQSRRDYEAAVHQMDFEVKDQYLAAQSSAKILKIYREGLIPQATATFQAGMLAYESGQEDFETLLGSFLDVLKFETESWRTLADHETAIARLKQLTGVKMP